jgi:hypothetical protein
MTTISVLAHTVAVCLAGLAIAAEPYEMFRGQCMGTTYAVKLADRPATTSLDSLAAEVKGELERIEQIFSLFRSDSELSRFNAAPAGTWIAVSDDLHAVTTRALVLAEQTGGAFDPTVGSLVRLWRAGAIASDWTPPSAAAIAEARRRVGRQLVEVRSHPPAMQKRSLGVELDLNALVEGWAIDRLIVLFGERGIHNVLVELGRVPRRRLPRRWPPLANRHRGPATNQSWLLRDGQTERRRSCHFGRLPPRQHLPRAILLSHIGPAHGVADSARPDRRLGRGLRCVHSRWLVHRPPRPRTDRRR